MLARWPPSASSAPVPPSSPVSSSATCSSYADLRRRSSWSCTTSTRAGSNSPRALTRIAIERHGSPARVRAEADRRAALDGADFVINSVNIGGHAATVTDFEVPEQFGLRQTIADTLGVGGIFRGLRTFPFLDELAQDMAAVCPQAWLLNYTNPMAMNVQFLARRPPASCVRLGLCHSVFWTVHDLCELIGVPLDEVSFASAGVNHQAWLLRWERDGKRPLPAAGRAHRRRPRAAPPGARRHVPPAGLLPDRDQRAQQRVRAVVPARPRRDRAPAHPDRRLSARSARATPTRSNG